MTDPWQVFEVRLAAYLSTMLDASDRLELHVPSADDASARVVLTAEDAARAADVATRTAVQLRDGHQLPHPSLLTASAQGPAAAGVGVLGLADAESVGADRVVEDAPPRLEHVVVQDAEVLRELVLEHLRTRDPEARLDDDGDIRFTYRGLAPTHGEIGGYLRIPDHEPVPVIGLFSVLMHSVTSTNADVELNVLNRKYRWSRWVRYGQHVVQELSVPAVPFDPTLLDALTDVFFADLVHVCVDLADRVGGTLTD